VKRQRPMTAHRRAVAMLNMGLSPLTVLKRLLRSGLSPLTATRVLAAAWAGVHRPLQT
jgi:hypothetical protein